MIIKHELWWVPLIHILSCTYFKVWSLWFQDIVTEVSTVWATAERAKIVEFTSSMFETYTAAFMSTKPKSSFFVMYPLHYHVWLAYAAMAVVVALAVYMFENMICEEQIRLSPRSPFPFRSSVWTTYLNLSVYKLSIAFCPWKVYRCR